MRNEVLVWLSVCSFFLWIYLSLNSLVQADPGMFQRHGALAVISAVLFLVFDPITTEANERELRWGGSQDAGKIRKVQKGAWARRVVTICAQFFAIVGTIQWAYGDLLLIRFIFSG